jgi:hypothetical protein
MEDVNARDQSCRVSAIMDGCEQAHLVPAKETEWWDANVSCSSSDSNEVEINSALNGVLLRADLHQSMDAAGWVPMAIDGDRLVVYVLQTRAVSTQFAELWHNVELQKLMGVDKRFLFARVAWAVLLLNHRFLTKRQFDRESLLVRWGDGTLNEVPPKAFRKISRPGVTHATPATRPKWHGLVEDDNGVIVDANVDWSDEEDDDQLSLSLPMHPTPNRLVWDGLVEDENGVIIDANVHWEHEEQHDVDSDSDLCRRDRQRLRTLAS